MRLECFVFTSCCLTSFYGCAAPFIFVPIYLNFDCRVQEITERLEASGIGSNGLRVDPAMMFAYEASRHVRDQNERADMRRERESERRVHENNFRRLDDAATRNRVLEDEIRALRDQIWAERLAAERTRADGAEEREMGRLADIQAGVTLLNTPRYQPPGRHFDFDERRNGVGAQ